MSSWPDPETAAHRMIPESGHTTRFIYTPLVVPTQCVPVCTPRSAVAMQSHLSPIWHPLNHADHRDQRTVNPNQQLVTPAVERPHLTPVQEQGVSASHS